MDQIKLRRFIKYDHEIKNHEVCLLINLKCAWTKFENVNVYEKMC